MACGGGKGVPLVSLLAVFTQRPITTCFPLSLLAGCFQGGIRRHNYFVVAHFPTHLEALLSGTLFIRCHSYRRCRHVQCLAISYVSFRLSYLNDASHYASNVHHCVTECKDVFSSNTSRFIIVAVLLLRYAIAYYAIYAMPKLQTEKLRCSV